MPSSNDQDRGASTPVSLDNTLIGDAWRYLISRALVVRQERSDTNEEGMGYNIIKYNPVGEPIGWVNPNLDVANIEAWIAVDEQTPVVLNLPRIEGRYYTAQIVDEWGEVITNINERNYPNHPYGAYAFVAPGSNVETPANTVRIDLRSHKAKMLARCEIKGDIEGAKALQAQFTLTPLGTPVIEPPVAVPAFDNQTLIGVELFDVAEALLRSAPDISPIAAQMATKVRDVVQLIADPDRRAAVDALVHQSVIPQFKRFSVTEAGAQGNNWIGTTLIGNYGSRFAIRSAANYIGIWANASDEVIYYVTTRDGEGNPLDGSARYVIDFPGDARADDVVDAYWSLSLVDMPTFVAVPNRINRYTFNSIAPPNAEADGSLRIYLAPEADNGIPESNWLPTPNGKSFSLTFRTYVPKDAPKRGEWFPPAVTLLA